MRLTRTLALASLLAPVPAGARAQGRNSLLVPFTMERLAADATSLDLSFLLDAPAGKHGFVRVRDGHLARRGTPMVNDPLHSTVVRPRARQWPGGRTR